jgi:hypothetical protein
MRVADNFIGHVRTLCRKVEEVLNNNDWPTEEGKDNEAGESDIRWLLDKIKYELEL